MDTKQRQRNIFANKKLDLLIILVIALIIPITLFLVGHSQDIRQHAALFSTNTLSLSPETGNLTPGEEINVRVQVKTDSSINALQVNLFYPEEALSVEKIEYAGSAFDIQAQEKITSGEIKLARGVIQPVSGTNLVATITFKVISEVAKGTTATVSFAPGTAVVESMHSKDVLQDTTPANYTIIQQ